MSAGHAFQELAEIALRDPALAGMRTIVEKELLHYDLLRILDRGDWLNGLAFQGGTALRLCYGAPRLSEDLDFSGGREFTAERMDGVAAFLKKELADVGIGVEVKPPKSVAPRRVSQGVGVSTWRIDVETEPGRRGLPKQKIKLDIDNAPTYTGEWRELAQNYGVLRDLRMLVYVQSREEILANKLVAFPTSVATRNRPRYRDVWDMRWLVSNGTVLHTGLVRAKMEDHRAHRAWMEAAAAKAVGIVRSAKFTAEMRRFLLPDTAKSTLDDVRYMDFLARETSRLIQEADECLTETELPTEGENTREPPR